MIKPGHQFGRIHRDDIAQAVVAAMRQDRGAGRRVLNLADDEPSESAAVITEAAALLGVAAAAGGRVRGRAAGHEPDGAQFLGGEPQGRQREDQGGAGYRVAVSRPTARDYAPSWPRSAATVWRSSSKVRGPGQAMVAVLDQDDPDIRVVDLLGDAQREFPGHVRVGLAVQQAHRAVDRDLARQHADGWRRPRSAPG